MDIGMLSKRWKCTLICTCLITACAVQPQQQAGSAPLTKATDVAAVYDFIRARGAAVERLESYPTKAEFWNKLQFWKRWRSGIEDVVVSGIRASSPREDSGVLEEVLIAGDAVSITNNQEAGVDEGGIVKSVGEHLVVMRRGQLFSLRAGAVLTKTGEADIQHPNHRHDAWYDELLVHGRTIIVVGYSYEAHAAEYVFFRLEDNGSITRQHSYLLKSSDYYSSENYASRLIGNQLAFLLKDVPVLDGWDEGEHDPLNAHTQQIDADGRVTEGQPLFSAHEIYLPIMADEELYATTIAMCPLEESELACKAVTVLGGELLESYASRDAYYLWMGSGDWYDAFERKSTFYSRRLAWSEYQERDRMVTAIYRIPFDGGPVGVAKIKGMPLNQFSLRESGGELQLISRVIDSGEYYYPESEAAGTTYFTAIPLEKLRGDVHEQSDSAYTEIQRDGSGTKLNRFIGEWALYIGHDSDQWDECGAAKLMALNTRSLRLLGPVKLDAAAEQVHPIGDHALVLGDPCSEEEAVTLTSIALAPTGLDTAATITLERSRLAEVRSHGFFYKTDTEGGIAALPVEQYQEVAADQANSVPENQSSAASLDLDFLGASDSTITKMLYSRLTKDLQIHPLGFLDAHPSGEQEDDCDVSCIDWYGSARPIFWGNRIFALIEAELIEGRLIDGRVEEVQRLNLKTGVQRAH